jgi:drug/metabolite transporter (DMT)-like permease
MTMSRAGGRGAAYATLALLTLVWGFNWIVMKLALASAHPVVLNLQRTWLAVAVLFAALVVQRKPLMPTSWTAIAVTGFFQTTINFGATTMAVAGGGAGRSSVLVFTMPFWTLLIAWIALGERVRGVLWLAVAFAFAGMVLVVAPWDWGGDLTPKLWAVLSGFGWAAGTVCTKHFQRDRRIDMTNFMAWQMLAGVLPLTIVPLGMDLPSTRWSAMQALYLLYIGAVSTAGGFILWIAVLSRLPAGTASLNMFAIPVIALVTSMIVFGERLAANEWLGIAAIGVGLAILSWRAFVGMRGVPETAPR